MIKALIFDLSRTLLFPKDKKYLGGLNDLYKNKVGTSDFKFFDHFVLNFELMEYVKKIGENVPVYIYTSDNIQNDPRLSETLTLLFKGIYSAKELGLDKDDANSYKYIANHLKLTPEEVLYVDDSNINCVAASAAGMITVNHNQNSTTINLITSKLTI